MLPLEVSPPAEEWRVATSDLLVYRLPEVHAALRGQIRRGGVFRVGPRIEGHECAGGWAHVDAEGYVCLTRTEASDAPEFAPIPDLPYVYGHRTARLPGQVYAGLAAWEGGQAPVASIPVETSWKFVETVETAKGPVLLRPDGRVLPVATTALYTPSTFVGRDLVAAPIPEGRTLAWCVQAKGCPTVDGEAIPFQGSFLAEEVVLVGRPLTRTFRVVPPPEGVGDDEVWSAISLGQQTLTLYRGATPTFTTLISGGRGGIYPTPRGTFRVLDKRVWNDMTSLADAEEPYAVDAVPWVVHVLPRIAIHAAYWHDQFGHVVSHGCVNLSPADAHRVFDTLGPALPVGWHTIWPAPGDPGSVVRIAW